MKRILRVAVYILSICCVTVVAQSGHFVYGQTISTDSENISLEQLFQEITEKTNIQFIVSEKSFLSHRVRRRVNKTVIEILKTTLGPYNKSYLYDDSGELVVVQILGLKQNGRNKESSVSSPGPEFSDEIQDETMIDIEQEDEITEDDVTVSDSEVDTEPIEVQDVDVESEETPDTDVEPIEAQDAES